MMIAARLAGGNLFFRLFCGGGFFWWGILGALGAARSSSEHSFFFEGICGRGILFFGGWGGVLDCKCWKKLKND